MIRGGLVTLFASDVERAVRFYVETLGMKLVEDGGTQWAVIDAGDGFRLCLQLAPREVSQGVAALDRGAFAPSIGLTTKVPIREAIAIFENRGVHFELSEAGPALLAHFRDPDDNPLHLCQER